MCTPRRKLPEGSLLQAYRIVKIPRSFPVDGNGDFAAKILPPGTFLVEDMVGKRIGFPEELPA